MKETLRLSILLTLLFVSPTLASADDPVRSTDPSPDGVAAFERDLEARVDAVLARRAALAEAHAMAALERREAGLLDGLSRATAARAVPPRSASLARQTRRVALADGYTVVRITAPARVDRSR